MNNNNVYSFMAHKGKRLSLACFSHGELASPNLANVFLVLNDVTNYPWLINELDVYNKLIGSKVVSPTKKLLSLASWLMANGVDVDYSTHMADFGEMFLMFLPDQIRVFDTKGSHEIENWQLVA